eukprot:1244074-Ditylum_brightwellii.AAC.1
MDKYLQTHHRQHSKQVEGMPSMVPLLSEIIDFNASTPFCDQMWQGTMPIDELEVEEGIKDYLHKLQTLPTDPPQLCKDLTTEEVIDGFKIWNE